MVPLYSITRSALGNKFAEDYSLPELGMKAALQRSKGGPTMSHLGQSLHFFVFRVLSALPPIATAQRTSREIG